MRVPLEAVVLDGPDAIEAGLLGEDGLLDTVLQALVFGVARCVDQLRFEDHGKLHGGLLLLSWAV